MSHSTYMKVTGVIFLIIAVVHLYRAIYGLPVVIGEFSVPVAASWVAVVVAGFLSYRGLKG